MPRPNRSRDPNHLLRPLPPSVNTVNQAVEHYRREAARLISIADQISEQLNNYTGHQIAHGQGRAMDLQLDPRVRVYDQRVADLQIQALRAQAEARNLQLRARQQPGTTLGQLRAPYTSYPGESETESENSGGGIFSSVKTVLSSILHGGRRQAPPAVRKILETNPDAKVVKAQAAIVPVGKPIQSFLNWTSGGKYEKKRQELGYNDINHAYVILTLDNGKTYRLEKNHVVEMYSYNVKNDRNDKIDLQLSSQPLLSSFLGNAEKYQESTKAEGKRGNFWQYDPQNNNCQYFVDDLVKGNTEVQNKEEANKFFFQPRSDELIETAGKWKTHLKYIVPLASIGDRLINGEGVPTLQRRCAHRYRPY